LILRLLAAEDFLLKMRFWDFEFNPQVFYNVLIVIIQKELP